jgi:hypothetical protein
MHKTGKLAVTLIALATAASASAFADTRPRNETWRDRSNRNESRRDQRQTITAEGRIRSINRYQDGYRVQLDRGSYSFYVPQQTSRSGRGRRTNDLRVGLGVRFSGWLDSGNWVRVSSWDFFDDYGRGGGNRYGYERYVSGIVHRVDFRRGRLVLRELDSRRLVTVEMSRTNRRRSADLRDLRRGDRVTLSGDWTRAGVFRATRIESVRSARY